MQRDMKLVRAILEGLAEDAGRRVWCVFDPTRDPVHNYHLLLLEDDGLIKWRDPEIGSEVRLTWTGHDYLESLRDLDVRPGPYSDKGAR